MRNSVFGLGLSVMLVAGCTSHPPVVGSYINSDSDAGWMVQIASSEGGAIKGNMTIVALNDKGLTTAVTRPISGTLSGNSVNLTVEGGSGLSLTTGIITPEGLDLTIFLNGGSQRLLFKRTSPNDFTSIVSSLRERAATLKQVTEKNAIDAEASRQRRAEQDRINGLVVTLSEKARLLANDAIKVQATTNLYRNVTTRATQLNRMQSAVAAKVGNDAYEAQQFSFTRQQNAQTAQSTHDDVKQAASQLAISAKEREQEASDAMALCVSKPGLDCSGLAPALNRYRQSVGAVLEAAAREDADYRAQLARF